MGDRGQTLTMATNIIAGSTHRAIRIDRLIIKRIMRLIHSLRPTNVPAKSNHVGNLNADRTIAALAQYAFVPDGIGHFFKFPTAPFTVKLKDKALLFRPGQIEKRELCIGFICSPTYWITH